MRCKLAAVALLVSVLGAGIALRPGTANAAGSPIPESGEGTGQKPQSKLWYNDGSWWAIIKYAGHGLHFFEFDGTSWSRCQFVDAMLGAGGEADVKWNGSELFVLSYSGNPSLFKYTYDKSLRVFNLLPGFPVALPIAPNSETMVLDQDSTGRLWATYEGGHGDVYVCWSTSADHREWNAPGIVIQSGVDDDDISTVVAFDRKIGVFWSDQARWNFGFRIHRDGDAPESWQPIEIVKSGTGIADDHLNMKADGQGNVYVVTKDINNQFRLHWRNVSTGKWTTKIGVISGTGTRPIVQVCDQDKTVYVAYTNWSSSALDVNLRKASYGTLSFSTIRSPFISGTTLNNCTGTKQVLPHDCLMVLAEGGGHDWWNGWGELPPDGPAPPPAPRDVRADLVCAPNPAETTPGTPLALELGFDEGAGDLAHDASPLQATAELRAVAGKTVLPTWVAGHRQSALQFDGSSGYAEMASSDALRIPGSLTVEAWVRWDGGSAPGTLISKGRSDRRNYQVRVLTDGRIDFLWEVSGGSNHGVTSLAPLVRGRWQHLACVYDAEAHASRIFLDGQLDVAVTDSGTPFSSTDALEIGMRFMSSGSPGDFLNGALDDLRVWRGALWSSNFDPEAARPSSAGPSFSSRTLVQVTWTSPRPEEPLTYSVYRQTNGGGPARIATALAATSFLDENPVPSLLCYQITATDSAGRESRMSLPACVRWSWSGPPMPDLSKPAARDAAPHELALHAYPNPFNPETRLALVMPQSGRARLAIYDVAGRVQAVLHDGDLGAGSHSFEWTATGPHGRLASGVYFARFETLGRVLYTKLLLVQ